MSRKMSRYDTVERINTRESLPADPWGGIAAGTYRGDSSMSRAVVFTHLLIQAAPSLRMLGWLRTKFMANPCTPEYVNISI